MKKKIKALVLTISVALLVFSGVTLAYLMDTDGSKGVMTIGNVDIVQNEYQWNADKTALEPFANDKLAMPAVGTHAWELTDFQNGAYRRLSFHNAVDKYVTVENTGSQPAYVRTIIAISLGTLDQAFFDANFGIHFNNITGEFPMPGAWTYPNGLTRYETIDGQPYFILEAVHLNPVAAGDETIPNLCQFYLGNSFGNAEVAALDGNGDGKVEILALSQAVQAQGFETQGAEAALNAAFGETTNANLTTWLAAIQ